MKKNIFSFPSQNGVTTVHGVRWTPDNGKYKAMVQLVHGMVEYVERYTDFARFLTENGFAVVGHDHVGHGDSVTSQEEWGYVGPRPSSVWLSDMHRVRKGCQKGKPYFMLGHSMGSYLLRYYLAKYEENINGAVLMGTGYMDRKTVKTAMSVAKLEGFFRGKHHRSELLKKLSYGKPYQKFDLTGEDRTNSWLTRDKAIVDSYYTDPKCCFVFTDNAYLGLFEAVLEACDEKNIDRLRKDLPLLLVSGEDDPVGDLGEGVRTLNGIYREKGIEDLTMILYPGDRHEILNELDREKVYQDILSWLEERI